MPAVWLTLWLVPLPLLMAISTSSASKSICSARAISKSRRRSHYHRRHSIVVSLPLILQPPVVNVPLSTFSIRVHYLIARHRSGPRAKRRINEVLVDGFWQLHRRLFKFFNSHRMSALLSCIYRTARAVYPRQCGVSSLPNPPQRILPFCILQEGSFFTARLFGQATKCSA